MNCPFHLIGLVPAGDARRSETLRLVTRGDARRGTPIFRAPALPTPRQVHSDVPFTANFGPRLRSRP